MTGSGASLVLPRGVVDTDGVRHDTVVFASLTGREEFVLSGLGTDPGPREVSTLLATCIARLGGYEGVDETLAAALPRADRDVALLGLRRLLFGERVSLVLRCPACEALADLDVQIEQLLPRERGVEHIDVDTPHGPARLRPPNGADDVVVADSALPTQLSAALLWSRLVVQLGDRDSIDAEDWLQLDAPTRLALGLALADAPGQPEHVVVTACPDCGAPYGVRLDPATLLLREVGPRGSRILAEVHTLAFHYHWSEGEILALPRSRRWAYLDLLRNELSGGTS